MNTRNSSNGKKQRRETTQKRGSKKQGQKRNVLHGNLNYHEQERIETRMTD
jgi:hypothetical protein